MDQIDEGTGPPTTKLFSQVLLYVLKEIETPSMHARDSVPTRSFQKRPLYLYLSFGLTRPHDSSPYMQDAENRPRNPVQAYVTQYPG